MKGLNSALGRAFDLGPLLVRVGIGVVFVWHAWVKLDGGVANFAAFLDSLGVPLSEVVAWLQVFAEGVGGLLLIAGLLTRLATIPLVGIMIGAILLVRADLGFIADGGPGASYETALLAGLLGLLFVGPGRISVDAVLGLEPGLSHPGGTAARPAVA